VRANRAVRPIPHLSLVADSAANEIDGAGGLEWAGDSEMQRAGLAWVAWRLRTGQITKGTARDQRYIVLYFAEAMGNRKPKQIGESDMERWLNSMHGAISPGTVKLRWRTIYLLLEHLIDEGVLRRNPARRIPTPKTPRAVHRNLRADQAAALHEACIDSRERLIVALSFQQALRRSEIARLQVGDIDVVDQSMVIVGAKTGNERLAPITVEAWRAIEAYLAETHAKGGPLVRDRAGLNGITPGYVGSIFREVAYRAGVKQQAWDGVGTHSGRHTAITDVSHTAGIIVARDLAGHASISTTNLYAGGLDLEKQREAVDGRVYGRGLHVIAKADRHAS
jgi:integrase